MTTAEPLGRIVSHPTTSHPGSDSVVLGLIAGRALQGREIG